MALKEVKLSKYCFRCNASDHAAPNPQHTQHGLARTSVQIVYICSGAMTRFQLLIYTYGRCHQFSPSLFTASNKATEQRSIFLEREPRREESIHKRKGFLWRQVYCSTGLPIPSLVVPQPIGLSSPSGNSEDFGCQPFVPQRPRS